MVYNLIIKTLAEQDITQAVEWYAQQSEQLQQQLIEAIDYSLESIKKTHNTFKEDTGKYGLFLPKISLLGFII